MVDKRCNQLWAGRKNFEGQFLLPCILVHLEGFDDIGEDFVVKLSRSALGLCLFFL